MAGNGNKKSGGTATLNPMQALEAAQAAAEKAKTDAVEALSGHRNDLAEQISALIDQIVETDTNLENLGVEDFEYIDLSQIAYCADLGTPTKRKRRSGGGGRGDGPRGSKPTTVRNAILISMNQSPKGTEFSPSEVHEAVTSDPVNYPFSAEIKGQIVQINGQLGKLVDDELVDRPSRGIYVITAKGQAAAQDALKEMNEKAAEG